MDADDSNLNLTPTETSFIIMGSQGESQQLSDAEQHAEILRSLPALQMPKKKYRNQSPQLIQQSDGKSSDASTKGKTASTDLILKTVNEEKQSENQQKAISEEELQDGDSANIIVDSSSTRKTSGPSHGQNLLDDDDNNNQSGVGQDKEEQTSPARQSNRSSNETSLSSRIKDSMGSYDQCELYKTQEGHIHGQRFSLLARGLSEHDLFEDQSDTDDDGRPIATPAQHIGSLQLSAEPMLVPESVDETEDKIPPSPDAYDAFHMIIPNSPTEGDSDGPETGDEEIADQTLCNQATYSTMADDDQIEENQENNSLKSYQIRGQTMADEVIDIKSQAAEGEASDSQFFALRLSPSQGEATQTSTALEKKQSLPEAKTIAKERTLPSFMPRQGTLLHPSSVVSACVDQFTIGESQKQGNLFQQQIETSKYKLNDNSFNAVQVAPLLTIGMIETQCEQSPSEPRFHLEKPGAGNMNMETEGEHQKNVFERARKSKKPSRIQDDSEDYVPSLRQEVVWMDTEQKENQGESEINNKTTSDMRNAMQLDTEPYDINETVKPGTSSDQTKQREAVQHGGQVISQPLITCTRQTVVAGLCPPSSFSVSVLRQDQADNNRFNESKAVLENSSGKMRHSDKQYPDISTNMVQKIEDVTVSKPDLHVAYINHPINEDQIPHVSCTAESKTLIHKQRQENLELAKPNRLSINRSLIATSSELYNKSCNTSRRTISTGKGKLVHKVYRRRENQLGSRSFELDTRKHEFSEELLHRKKRRKIDPYTLCSSTSQTASGRKKMAQNPVVSRWHSNPKIVVQERTPILLRKRRRPIHKMKGLLKSSSSGDSERSCIKPKAHVHFQTDQSRISDSSLRLAPDTASGLCPQHDQLAVTESSVVRSAVPTTPALTPSTLPQLGKQNVSLPLKQSQVEKYEKWKVVTNTVMQFNIIKVEERIVHQETILSNKIISTEKDEPRVIDETTEIEVELISPYLSPSRSVSTLTSGDLGDISSSGQTLTSAESKEKDQHEESGTHNIPYTRAGSVVDNPHSDVEHSAAGTPQEASTINKTGSYTNLRTFSGEGSKGSDSLFGPSEKSDSIADKSSPSSAGKGEVTKQPTEPLTTSTVGTSAVQLTAEMRSRKSESDEISPEIPYPDKLVGSTVSDIESSTTASRTIKSSDQPGSNVFAKWKDGFFYPGKIVSTDGYKRYKVLFEDGDSRTVKNSNLLLVEQLPVGQNVLVKSSENQIYVCGLIIRRSPSHYIVKKDDGIIDSYSLDAVILSEDHAGRLLINEGDEATQICPVAGPPVLPTNLADVSLDNLVEGKRRTCKSESHQADTESKHGGNESASKRRGRKRKLADIEPQATSTPTPKGKTVDVTKDRGGVPECSSLMTVEESPITSHRQSPRKAKIALFGDLKGPLPTKKTLFKGLVFILTYVVKTIDQKEGEKKLLEDSSLEALTDFSTGEEDIQIPFDKDHLKKQIERGGGTVLDKFDPELVCGSSHCYLLSNTYQRTIKYLKCLAAGVPCVSHLWIIDSCKQGLLLGYGHYILPAGISLEKKRIMECKTGTQPLLNLRVSVVSKNDKFTAEWIKILQLAKCVIIDKFPPPVRSDDSSRPEVIITDSNISPAHEKRAKQLKIPLVSSEWVIQSLINSQKVKFDGHPQYSYNYSNV